MIFFWPKKKKKNDLHHWASVFRFMYRFCRRLFVSIFYIVCVYLGRVPTIWYNQIWFDCKIIVIYLLYIPVRKNMYGLFNTLIIYQLSFLWQQFTQPTRSVSVFRFCIKFNANRSRVRKLHVTNSSLVKFKYYKNCVFEKLILIKSTAMKIIKMFLTKIISEITVPITLLSNCMGKICDYSTCPIDKSKLIAYRSLLVKHY